MAERVRHRVTLSRVAGGCDAMTMWCVLWWGREALLGDVHTDGVLLITIGVVVTGFMRCEKMRVPWVRDVARVVAVRHWSIGCIFCYVHSFPKC